ncbi:MAG TPA: TlpA disulfide reductase family protein, partial [Isosphaeraceae bacterium]
MTFRIRLAVLASLLAASPAPAAEVPTGPPFRSVADLRSAHDRALMRDLGDYLARNPRADDRDQAYMALFDTAIDHDWFGEAEPTARRYLEQEPDGAVRPLAQIVATMARAQTGQYAEALAQYKGLMEGLGGAEQQDFAVNFADSLASSAAAAGEPGVARRVYETLLERFADNSELGLRVRGDIERLDRVGKPAPVVESEDLTGQAIRLADLKGKFVLVDFWATWCAPCVAELPDLQATYARYHPQGLEVVAVSLDDTKEAVSDFVG